MVMKDVNNYPFRVSVLLVFCVTASVGSWRCSIQRDVVSYNQDIRPIFNKKCLACHGGVKQLGDFSLLFEEEAFSSTESGVQAIIPGNASKSELMRRILHHDPDERMPFEEEALTENEKNLIRKWIDQGATWEQHWSYIPPKVNTVPNVDSDWVNNGIDPFILKKLAENNLEPAEEADKFTIIRRASLDLTGLTPNQESINEFIRDKGDDAYEKMIDRLLDSQHYGERWTAMWLDLARYADSQGYEKDNHRNIWRYRDWVINAFNDDKPFDQFTIEQLAGDLLPNPNLDQLIATAFNRNTMTNDEGGTTDEEFRLASVIDRINTTFEVWQSTTLACVQCHSHPYDPIRHDEFYSVMDLFNQTVDNDLGTDIPVVTFYTQEDQEKIDDLISYIQDIEGPKHIENSASTEQRIKKALFPVLTPGHCDDFENVVFTGNGIVSNWSQNLQAIGEKKYRFLFSNIDVTDLTSITYAYGVDGYDARIEVRLDSKDGKLLSQHDFNSSGTGRGSKDDFSKVNVPVNNAKGIHDLVFHIINKTGKIPDGMLSLSKIELHYNSNVPSKKLTDYKDKLRKVSFDGDKTPVMRPKKPLFKRTTKVFDRGNWAAQTKEVKAKVPNSLLASGARQPENRLEFAKWLVSPENPLTARVIVNRFWEQIFGSGIIESLEDFGTQGLPPSHPELLDWLALRFMNEHQWSVKSLLKEIVMSSSYRQASITDAYKTEKDPYNRLLSRGPRFRLSAEQIRDEALHVAGLLNQEIGGESVMPLQPDGVWAVVYNNQKWETSTDDQRNRRGLYTYWKRTAPYPSMVTFDSPSREFCVSRRIRTNTPLQALVTLNDPVYLEAAESLGKEMKIAADENLESAFQLGYQKALCRQADKATIDVLKKLYRQAQEELKNPIEEQISVSIEDLAFEFRISEPMTVVANAIMNLDGFVMKN